MRWPEEGGGGLPTESTPTPAPCRDSTMESTHRAAGPLLSLEVENMEQNGPKTRHASYTRSINTSKLKNEGTDAQKMNTEWPMPPALYVDLWFRGSKWPKLRTAQARHTLRTLRPLSTGVDATSRWHP